MRRHLPKVLPLLMLAAVLGAGTYGLHWYRHRYIRNEADLLALLPPEDATVVFVDLRALRASPAGRFIFQQGDQQADYRDFIRQTGWNYATDLQRVVLGIGSRTTYAVLQGRWDWSALRSYAAKHGGSCANDECSLPGSTPDKLISFAEVQPDVLALAVGAQPKAVQTVLASRGVHGVSPPADRIWMKIAPHVLQHPENLPLPIQVFLNALRPASDVTLFLRPASQANADSTILLAMELVAPDAQTAITVASRLRTQTDSVRTALQQAGVDARQNDLLKLVASGSFHSEGRTVFARWPVDNELVNQIRP